MAVRLGLWRQRNFALFWTGESISEVGNSVTVIVVPLIAIDTLHTSTFIVTLLTAMVWMPWVIIGVPAGAWIDRLPPRPVTLACDAISLVVYASVPAAAWSGGNAKLMGSQAIAQIGGPGLSPPCGTCATCRSEVSMRAEPARRTRPSPRRWKLEPGSC